MINSTIVLQGGKVVSANTPPNRRRNPGIRRGCVLFLVRHFDAQQQQA